MIPLGLFSNSRDWQGSVAALLGPVPAQVRLHLNGSETQNTGFLELELS